MATKEENTVAENVTLPTVQEIDKSRFEAEKNYRVAVKIASAMLGSEIITAEEYAVIDTNLRGKFRPISCDI